jgi:hypothetical protein
MTPATTPEYLVVPGSLICGGEISSRNFLRFVGGLMAVLLAMVVVKL